MMYGWKKVLLKLLNASTRRSINNNGEVENVIFPAIDINKYNLSSFENMAKNGYIEVFRLLISAHNIAFDKSGNVKGISKDYNQNEKIFLHQIFKLKIYKLEKGAEGDSIFSEFDSLFLDNDYGYNKLIDEKFSEVFDEIGDTCDFEHYTPDYHSFISTKLRNYTNVCIPLFIQ
ncbi:hypothetical protein AYI70_g11597 [Smittium culicis]|uniref:Uncharacterized protein n=1 Tax=Smittium culicis TaxID=133412 RepID=A0A1R1X141_9FUNG|nr:hypothetical protein AYI70_g11665 [Smittium culicis]OMJ08355.1 hypothetical protein AYI70_g11597 [Smittium culicis]